LKGSHLGEFEELVLLCVRHLAPTAHGAAVQEHLSATAGRRATLGAIYAALDRTERKGLVRSWLEAATGGRGGKARRHWALTPAGERAVLEARRVRERLWAPVEEASP